MSTERYYHRRPPEKPTPFQETVPPPEASFAQRLSSPGPWTAPTSAPPGPVPVVVHAETAPSTVEPVATVPPPEHAPATAETPAPSENATSTAGATPIPAAPTKMVTPPKPNRTGRLWFAGKFQRTPKRAKEAPPPAQYTIRPKAATPASTPAVAPAVAAPPAATTPTATPPPPSAKPVSPPSPPAPPVRPIHWALLAVIVIVGFALRLREPLSSPIMGAEDPYLHMERTWNMVQGKSISNYPPGLMVLLFPFTLLGPDTFYQVVRFAPPFIGVGAIVATFFLCRPYLPVAGSLGAALFVATMREHIFRTDIMMPTALDMVLLPVLFLAMLRAGEGNKWALRTAGIVGVILLLAHPWAVGLAAIPLGLFWVIIAVRKKEARKWVLPASAAGAFTFFMVLSRFESWNASNLIGGHAFPRFMELVGNPGSLFVPPVFVDLPRMIGWAALLLAAGGGVFAVRHRSRFGLLAILWTALLLPLVLVDWFDIWYIPHRTVVYFSLGVAMLAGLAIGEIVKFVEEARPKSRKFAMVATLGIAFLLMLPGAIGTQKWYRVYDQNDFDAFQSLEDKGKPYVIAGSWEGRAGYRGMTGAEAEYMPKFFEDDVHREFMLRERPDLVVLVDNRTHDNKHDTSFLHDWALVGEWGDVKAYTKKAS